jgi:hypothetical protein
MGSVRRVDFASYNPDLPQVWSNDAAENGNNEMARRPGRSLHDTTRKSNTDPADIFVVADQYRNAAKWIILAENRGWPPDVKMPGITCSAFALELYFKSLLAMEHSAIPESHDLLHLFNRLQKNTQQRVRKNFEPYLMTAGRMVSQSAQKAGYPVPEVDFDFVLNASRKAFPSTRYIYEQGLRGGEGWLADGIMEAARATILQAHPDWAHARQVSPSVVVDIPPLP